jgi:hypothetical protein
MTNIASPLSDLDASAAESTPARARQVSRRAADKR